MDKAQKTYIRLLSIMFLLCLDFLLLLVFLRGSLFQNILNLINLNSDKLTEAEKNLYNLQYYTALNMIYRFIFSFAILAVFVAFVAVLSKLSRAGRIAVIGSYASIATAIVVIVARALEGNKTVHKKITNSFLGINGDDFVTMQALPKLPIVPILIIIVSLLCLAMVKSSKIEKIRLYNKASALSGTSIYLVAMYGYVGIDVLRNNLSYMIMNKKDLACYNALNYLRTFFIDNNKILSLPISYILIFIIGLGIVTDKYFKKKIAGIVSVLIPSLISIVIIVINVINKPVILGNVTTDLNICDMVDFAYYAFLVNFFITCLYINLMLVYIISVRGNKSQMLILITLNIILNLICQLIAKNFSGIAIHFVMWSVADLISAIVVLILMINIHRLKKKKRIEAIIEQRRKARKQLGEEEDDDEEDDDEDDENNEVEDNEVEDNEVNDENNNENVESLEDDIEITEDTEVAKDTEEKNAENSLKEAGIDTSEDNEQEETIEIEVDDIKES